MKKSKRENQKSMTTPPPVLDLELLSRPAHLDLDLNDLRIILGCFRAVVYQETIDGETYLNAEAIDLMHRLERLYGSLLKESETRCPS